MAIDQKDQKIEEIIRELAAEFFARESDRTSMITVTEVHLMSRGGKALIKISVFPESEEQKALEFANRQMHDFKEFVIQKSRLGRIPFFEVVLDIGEKNRQNIDDISKRL